MIEYDQAVAAAAAAAAHAQSTNQSPNQSTSNNNNNKNRLQQQQQHMINNEMIKELKKRNPNQMGGGRTRAQPSKKEINIEDLIEEINRGYVTADAERRKRQRTQEIKKDFVKTTPIQII